MNLGVFGGTFNPIHRGHLHIATSAQMLFGLEEVYFVVAGAPPHKEGSQILAFEHRYAMVSLATSGAKRFIPSLIELQPPASPYSIDTLAKLQRSCNVRSTELYFIAGADSLLEMAGWRGSEELLSCYNFIFAVRPGVRERGLASALPAGAGSRLRDLRGLSNRRLRRCIREEQASGQARAYVIEVGAPNISGSKIRALRRNGRRMVHLVPNSVYQYIQKQHLYGE
jgi:nicotinate-nucleotide adenylyltransferase